MVRLFEGYEAEGRYKGIRTLFVSGDVPWETIKNVIDIPDKYAQIYFGADGCSDINWETVKSCDDSKLVNIISAEIDECTVPSWVLSSLNHDVQFVVKINNVKETELDLIINSIRAEWSYNNIQIKFDTSEQSYLAPIESFINNDRNDISDDVELWRQE